jgi:hypothetical protein
MQPAAFDCVSDNNLDLTSLITQLVHGLIDPEVLGKIDLLDLQHAQSILLPYWKIDP